MARLQQTRRQARTKLPNVGGPSRRNTSNHYRRLRQIDYQQRPPPAKRDPRHHTGDDDGDEDGDDDEDSEADVDEDGDEDGEDDEDEDGDGNADETNMSVIVESTGSHEEDESEDVDADMDDKEIRTVGTAKKSKALARLLDSGSLEEIKDRLSVSQKASGTKRFRQAHQPNKARRSTSDTSASLGHNMEKLPDSRSILTIPTHLLPVSQKASETIVRRTFFENPFPTAPELSEWVCEAWDKAFYGHSVVFEKPIAICRREIRSHHWRVKSQLVYVCKSQIEDAFRIDRNDQTQIRSYIKWLLEDDRYTCANREETKLRFLAPEIPKLIYRSYFRGERMRGRIDSSFLTRINIEFICFVTTVMHHCLKAWQTGIFIQPGRFRGGEPKSVWVRHRNTWKNLSPSLQSQLLTAIKDEVQTMLGRDNQHPQGEPTAGLIDDEPLLQEEIRLRHARSQET